MLLMKAISESSKTSTDEVKSKSVIESRNAKMNHLYSKLLNDGSHKAHLDLSSEIIERMRTDHVFEDFAGGLDDS